MLEVSGSILCLSVYTGEEAADLVDCRIGLHLLQLPTKMFWDGFEDMGGEFSLSYGIVSSLMCVQVTCYAFGLPCASMPSVCLVYWFIIVVWPLS